MNTLAVLVSAALLLGQKEPPPLSAQQRDQLTVLVKTTQTRAAELKAQLEKKQQELARLYAEFQLDLLAVEKLQNEVVELQRQLLLNYHQMHVELRKIVGPERFATLRQRLDNVLGITPAKKPRDKER